MSPVTSPEAMNEAFARAFNSGQLHNLLALYEDEARLCVSPESGTTVGLHAIGEALAGLLQTGGTIASRNVHCIQWHDIALLRAEWQLRDDAGAVLIAGSSAEVVRRQADGTWRYVIDHATGAMALTP